MRWLSILAIFFTLTSGPACAAEIPADLELVLAIDASGSVDEGEFRLQMQGIARAFQDPQILKAIASGPTHRIAVCLVVWAEHQAPKDISPWHVIGSAAEAARFARTAARYPRTVNGATGMGEGLAAAIREIEGNGIAAPRRIVDISGDGRETPARDYVVLMPQARSMAAFGAVTVNGLAILGSEEGLLEWYQNNVLVGSDSFVETAKDYDDFAKAIKRKLLREIESLPRVSWN
jgi:hypothetical protein